MKTFPLLLTLAVLVPALAPAAEPTFDDTMKQAAVDYRERAARAAEALNRTRQRIAAEKAPLLEQMRAAENRLLAAESETTRLETGREDATEQRRKLLQELDALRKTITYAGTLAHDSLRAAADGLAPGETQIDGERFATLLQQLEDPAAGARPAMDAMDFLLTRTERAVGGWRAEGSAMDAATNEIQTGTFAFAGPETWFRPTTGGLAGTVRPREGAKFPATYVLKDWPAESAAAFFAGRPGVVLADASGGKALRLRETTGTVWDHVRKGGVVALAILGVGALSVFFIVAKLRELTGMTPAAADQVTPFLAAVSRGDRVAANAALGTLRPTTRDLFATGLRHADEPKALLEERLQAVLLAQRLHFERRLPLLAVIATAAPLMGLLGTVVGMVKTFTLITVFGTGNAAKLSSGISEVLVATELGLVVAIPTLVIHGFLAQRVQRNLSLLERQALEFCTAVATAPSPTVKS